VDEDLDAARSELHRLDADADDSAKVRQSIEEILGMVEGIEWDTSLEGYTPERPGKAPERLTVGWLWMLQNEVAEALTPGKRGATPPLSKWAIEETRWLVERLGCFMVLSRNNGDGPRLIDQETGDNVAVALAERLEGQNPARWPDVSIGVGVTLSTQRAALRGESAPVRRWSGRRSGAPVAKGEVSTLLVAEWRNIGHSEWRCKVVEMADMHYSAVS
jgi:hypothetical protein